MRATIEGKVLAKAIQEPNPNFARENAKTKYIVAIHQPGELEPAKVDCTAEQYQKYKEGADVSIPVKINAWKTEKAHGLSVKHA